MFHFSLSEIYVRFEGEVKRSWFLDWENERKNDDDKQVIEQVILL